MAAAKRTLTRSQSSSKSTTSATKEPMSTSFSTQQKAPLARETSNPPKLFLLPKAACSEAQLISLPHPRDGVLTRYYCCPESGIYEFTKIAAPRTTPRSILLARSTQDENTTPNSDLEDGYVVKAADIYIATLMDPAFLLLPVVYPPLSCKADGARKFRSLEDHLDSSASRTSDLQRILASSTRLRKLFQTRAAAVCDVFVAPEGSGVDDMFRLSVSKLVHLLIGKASKMIEGGLPPSIEETLVRRALDRPAIPLKRGESSTDITEDDETMAATFDCQMTSIPKEEGGASCVSCPSSSASCASCISTPGIGSITSTAMTTPTTEPFLVDAQAAKRISPHIVSPSGIPELLRLRTALDFIIASYLPVHLAQALKIYLASATITTSSVSDSNPILDFQPLDAHLAELAALRQEALARDASRYSRKRGLEDEEEVMDRAEKRRKKEEEEKRAKAGISRGVRDLKKVDTKGMRKMSDFFGKK